MPLEGVLPQIVASRIFGKSIHTPFVETQHLIIKGQMQSTGPLHVCLPDSDRIVNGFQSNGDFIVSETTQDSEWTLASNSNWTKRIVVGHRIGQLCQVHLELQCSSPPQNGEPFVLHMPDSFCPGTKLIHPIFIWTPDTQSMTSAVAMFDPTSKHIYFFGTWEPNGIVTGLIFTHPYSSLVFSSFDIWCSVGRGSASSRAHEFAKPNANLDWNHYFCAHVSKAGKRCRMEPKYNGVCKRHSNIQLRSEV